MPSLQASLRRLLCRVCGDPSVADCDKGEKTGARMAPSSSAVRSKSVHSWAQPLALLDVALLERTHVDGVARPGLRSAVHDHRQFPDVEAQRGVQRKRLILKESWNSLMPRDSAPRSITAVIRCRPTPGPCTSGAAVSRPTPLIGPRSSRKLDPTILPSASATMPQILRCTMRLFRQLGGRL